MQDNPDTTIDKSSKTRQKGPQTTPAGSFTAGGSGGAGAGASSSSFGASASTTDTMNQAKEKLTDAGSQAGDKVASRLDSQKDKAAEGLGSVAQALRQASDQLRGQNDGAAGHEYVASAANQVERLSDYLRSTNTKDMVSGVERFARQQPALFVGGAFMLGLLGARFLKSSGVSSFESSSYRSRSHQEDERSVPRSNVNATPAYGEQGYAGTGRTPTREYTQRPPSAFTRRGGEGS